MDIRSDKTDAPLDDGLPCRECGYDLRGLHGFKCPECGEDIDLFGHFARRAWSFEARAIAEDRRAIRFRTIVRFFTLVLLAAACVLTVLYRARVIGL